MKFCRPVSLALACLLALAVPAYPQTPGVDAPSDQFFRGFLLKSEAEKMESTGNLAGALSLYRQMQSIFDGLAQSYPEWQSDMLSNRRSLTQQAISRVEARQSQPMPAAAAPAPILAPAPAPASAGLIAPAGAIPTPGTLATPALASSTTGALPSLSDALTQWEQAYRQRLLLLESQNSQMQLDLGKWQQWYQWASGEITTARGDKEALGKKSAELEKAVKSMEKEVAEGRASSGQLETLTKEKLTLEVEYRKTTQRLAAAEQASKEASQKLADASLRVSGLETERNKLLAERDEAIKKRDEAVKGRDIAVQERNTATAQNLGMKTELETLKKTSASGDMQRLMAENERLRKELDTAQKQVASLKSDVTRKDQELVQLRGQLTSLQGELATLRQQSSTYQTQVADLTVQLKKLQENTPPAGMDPKLAQENTLLREIVMRQLRSQYRQQQAKDLVIAELQKTEGVSQDLLKQVEELKNARMILTPDEEKMFTDPQIKEMLGRDSIQGTLIASAGNKPTAPAAPAAAANPATPAEGLIDKANETFANKKFPEAAALYEDALRADPKSTTALVGLGYSRQREGKLQEAEAALKKCLALDPNNEPASFHLGVTHFKQQRWNDAMTDFEKALAKRAQNANARHYLGIISTKLNLMERAEREFKTAIAIEPSYGEAHFNLAVLYVTWDPPQWDKAKASYDEALKQGVSPDAALEKLLTNNGAKSISVR
ncbi:MAG: tetratricopeptide repeat protein [Prosthecobacter sp.]|nr:tetratricopeptide repeat protein [Prosthecobacter sp.]